MELGAFWEWCHAQKEGCVRYGGFFRHTSDWYFLGGPLTCLKCSFDNLPVAHFVKLWARAGAGVSRSLRTAKALCAGSLPSPRTGTLPPTYCGENASIFSLSVLLCTSEVGMPWSIFPGGQRKNRHELCHPNHRAFQSQRDGRGTGPERLLKTSLVKPAGCCDREVRHSL